MPSAYFFVPATYDFQQATLVEGALACDYDVAGNFESNYCPRALAISDWSELTGFDLVFFGERTLDFVARLTGKPRHPAIVYVDGADTQEIVLPPKKIHPHLFKRELSMALSRQCSSIKGMGFGIERRYLQGFVPFRDRKFLLSCMMRLDTNDFRKVLKASVDSLKARYGASIVTDSTGEVSYNGYSGHPQPTPQYTSILQNSQIAVSCHGAGEDTGRFWEILGAGCLLFSQRIGIAIPDLPQDGEHCVYFDNERDFFEKAQYYLSHLDEAEQMARKGQAYALEKSSTRARFEYMVRSLEQRPQALTWQDRLLIHTHNLRLRYQQRLKRLRKRISR